MGNYSDDLSERDYYDSLLGKGQGDPDTYGYLGEKRWVGKDKPKVQRGEIWIVPVGQFEGTDNAPNDPEQNWDESNES